MIAMKLTGSRCRCGKCGERFNSLSAFDAHRVGPYRQFSDPIDAPDRRCLAVAEMFRKGMGWNARGFWITETRANRRARSGSLGRAPRSGLQVTP